MSTECHADGIRIEGVRHQYDGRTILDLPTFVLEAGEQAVVIGPSGCGKTTLLTLLAGLMRPSAGRICVAGQDLVELAARGARVIDRFRARSIGLVPQQPTLFGMLDALDNLLLARHLAGLPPQRDASLELLAAVGLQGLEHRRPAELSRGQQQRVAIARALVNRPTVILADEPTANLDDDRAAQVIDLLRDRAAAADVTLLVATHDGRVRTRFGRVLTLDASGHPA